MLQQPPGKEEQIATTRGQSSADRDIQRAYIQGKSQQPRGRSRQSQQPDGKHKQIATTRKQSRSWEPENKGPRQIETNKKKAKQNRSLEPENKGPRQIETTRGQIREDRNNQGAVQGRSQQPEIHRGNSRQQRSNQIGTRNYQLTMPVAWAYYASQPEVGLKVATRRGSRTCHDNKLADQSRY